MHQNHLQIAILRYEKITELHLNVWTLPPDTLKLASTTTFEKVRKANSIQFVEKVIFLAKPVAIIVGNKWYPRVQDLAFFW